MKLVHLSDIHIHTTSIFGQDPVLNFASVLHNVCDYHNDADHIVISGDLTHEGDVSSYKLLKAMLDNSEWSGRLKPRLLLGNHDNRKNFLSVFDDSMTDENGFVQWTENTDIGRLIYLDTQEPGTQAGHLCSKRMSWLVKILKKSEIDNTPAWLFMHHNPISVRVANADAIGLVQLSDFEKLILRFNSTLKHIFFGHCHFTLSGSRHGVSFSAPRSTNHPCWPDLGKEDTGLAYGPLEKNYNVCFCQSDSVLVHTVDFDRQSDIVFDRSDWHMHSKERLTHA